MWWFASSTGHGSSLRGLHASVSPHSNIASAVPFSRAAVLAVSSRTVQAFLILLAFSPALLLMTQVTRYWVDVPYADEWDISLVFDKHFDSGVDWRTLFCQHNESRKPFPRLIILGLGLLSGFDVRWEICVILLCASLISLNLFLMLRQVPERSWHERLFLLTLCNLLLFSPAQWINWLTGIQMVAFIPPLMLTWGLLLNASNARIWPKTAGTCLAAFVGTYSYANGMLLWALLCPLELLGIRRHPNQSRTGLLILPRLLYAISAASSILFYFHDYHTPPQSPPFSATLEDPVRTLSFLLTWMGGPFSSEGSRHSTSVAMAMGGSILAAFVIGLKSAFRAGSNCRFRLYPWIVLGFYSLMSGMITSAGRVGDGMGVARVSRYVSFSLYLPIAAAVVLWLTRSRRRWAIVACGVWTAALLFFHGEAASDSMKRMKRFSQSLHDGRLALQLHTIYRDEGALEFLYPDHNHVLRRFNALKRRGLLNFSAVDSGLIGVHAWDMRQPVTSCGFVDWCTQLNPDLVECSGWAYLTPRRASASNVILAWRAAGGEVRPCALFPIRASRPDVAAVFGERTSLISGFHGRARLPPERPSQVIVSGWTVDIEEGIAYELRGRFSVTTGMTPKLKDEPSPERPRGG
ncbi:hypothetical protein JXA88_18900 [Candidatus Fermentibacteria bacterium]|nr:hypothetical protein [Candidatus Fermentibacteria bacterium]